MFKYNPLKEFTVFNSINKLSYSVKASSYFFSLVFVVLIIFATVLAPTALAAGNVLLEDPYVKANLELSKTLINIDFDSPKTLFETSEIVKAFDLEKDSTYQVKVKNNPELQAQIPQDDASKTDSTVLNLSTSQTPLNTPEINKLYQVIQVKIRTKNVSSKVNDYKSKNPEAAVEIRGLNQDEKKVILDQANFEKETIKIQKQDAIDTQKAKIEKDKRVTKFKEDQKAKRKEIQKKVKEGKSSEITIEDAYILGETGQEFGVEVLPPEKKDQPTKLRIDENKVKNYKKDNTVVDNISEFFEGLLAFGSVKAEAFTPEFYNTDVYHATPKAHMGTVFDLFSGNTSNGATIGTWGKHNGWNQKYYLYSDDTIRMAGKCLDLSNNSAYNGGKIQLWDCNNSNAQKWTYDTGGRIRLRDNFNWCLDNDYGGWGAKLYLWQCTSNTEKWRPSNFEMRLYSRTGPSSPGHEWVQIAQFDDYNNVVANTSYSMWPGSGFPLYGIDDNDSQNTETSSIEANDRSRVNWLDNRWVNRSEDLRDGYDATQYGDYRNNTSYWLRWLPSWQYDQIKDGGYKIDPYIYIVIDNCATYSTGLWLKYGGRSSYYSAFAGSWVNIYAEIPGTLTGIMYIDYGY
jgi:hypothetical protein